MFILFYINDDNVVVNDDDDDYDDDTDYGCSPKWSKSIFLFLFLQKFLMFRFQIPRKNTLLRCVLNFFSLLLLRHRFFFWANQQRLKKKMKQYLPLSISKIIINQSSFFK